MDSQQLKDHLADTGAYIEQHRAMMMPGGRGYSDVPTGSGCGPRSPLNEHSMHLGDLEAAFVGNLARHCMVLGTIPLHSLKGLWFLHGVCHGVRTTGAKAIRPLINHLIDHADDIVATEGVEPLLKAGEDTRWWSKRACPQEADRWLTIEQAMELTGRSRFTINQWRRKGWVKCLDDRWGVMYSQIGLETVLAAMEANRRKGGRPKGS